MMADPAQARPLVGAFITALSDELAALGFGPFGHHNDAEAASAFFPLADAFAHALDVVRNFGNQDDIAPAGHAGMQRDPAGVAAHHFANEYAMMRFGGGMKAVDGIGRDR